LPIVLEDGLQVNAIVPVYSGRNVASTTDTSEIAVLALRAKGTSGSCTFYIESIADLLRRLGIEDPTVVAIESAIRNLAAQQKEKSNDR